MVKQLSQGETFHGGFALLQEDGTTPTQIEPEMNLMVILRQGSSILFKATTQDGSMEHIGGGQYVFTVSPEQTSQMVGRIVVELKIYDAQNNEVVIGMTDDPKTPLVLEVISNKIHSQK